jgi:hypothetical protein
VRLGKLPAVGRPLNERRMLKQTFCVGFDFVMVLKMTFGGVLVLKPRFPFGVLVIFEEMKEVLGR